MSTPNNKTVNIYINSDQANAALQKLNRESDKLTKSIDSGRVAGKDMTAEMAKLAATKDKIQQLEGVISGKMAPSIKMVRQNVTQLRNELNGMSADAPGYAAKFKSFEAASTKLKEMETSVKGVKTQMNSAAGSSFFGKMKDGLLSGLGIGSGIAMFQQALGFVRDFIADSRKMAYELEGVENAFNHLNKPELLDKLRAATKGTVTDLTLMKRAVQADQLGISLDKLPELLDFARRRAKDTGQEVDYLVDSIVLGLGRKSILILDNLGISSVELQAEFAKTGDFAQAAFNIIQRGAKDAGKDIDTLYEKQQRFNTVMANTQAKIGEGVNFISGFFQAALADLVSEGNFELTGQFIEQTKEAGKLKKEELAINKAANNLYEQQFKKLTENIVKADKDGRDQIRKQAEVTRDRLLAGAKMQYGAESKEYERLQQSIQKAYGQTLKLMVDNPMRLENISSKQLSQLPKGDLETLKQQGETSLGSMTINDPNREITLDKIAAIDKLLEKFRNNKVAAKAGTDQSQQRAEITREFELLKAEVETITTDETAQLSAEQEKQLQAVSNKYLALTEKAKKYKVTLLGLTETQEKEYAALQDKFFKQRSEKEYADSLKSLDLFYAGQKDKLLQQQLDKTITQEEYNALLLQLERDHAADRLQVATDYAPQVKAAEEAAQKGKTDALVTGIADQKRIEQNANNEKLYALERGILAQRKGSKGELEARKQFLEEQFAQETAHLDKSSNEYQLKQQKHQQTILQLDKDFNKNRVQMAIDSLQQMYSMWQSFQQLQQQAADNAHSNEIRRMDEEGERWKKLLDEKKISQTIYNEQIEKLEEQKREKENEHRKKAFEQQKKQSLIQIAISTALAIMDIWSKWAALPVVAGIFTAGVAILGGAQAAAVAGQEYPEMAKGGLLDGASHAEGGIPLVAEGGEAILSKETVRNNRALVNALLDSSTKKGGASLPDWMFSQAPAIRNDIPMFSRPSYSQMGNGGMVSNNTAAGGASAGSSSPVMDAGAMLEFAEAVREFKKMTEKGIRANVFYDDIDKKNKEITGIKDRSTMGG